MHALPAEVEQSDINPLCMLSSSPDNSLSDDSLIVSRATSFIMTQEISHHNKLHHAWQSTCGDALHLSKASGCYRGLFDLVLRLHNGYSGLCGEKVTLWHLTEVLGKKDGHLPAATRRCLRSSARSSQSSPENPEGHFHNPLAHNPLWPPDPPPF